MEIKNEKIENVLIELEECKLSLKDQTTKNNSLKARNKVLEMECKKFRDKISTLISKIEKDDGYIQALVKKISLSKPENHDCEKKLLEKVSYYFIILG